MNLVSLFTFAWTSWTSFANLSSKQDVPVRNHTDRNTVFEKAVM